MKAIQHSEWQVWVGDWRCYDRVAVITAAATSAAAIVYVVVINEGVGGVQG